MKLLIRLFIRNFCSFTPVRYKQSIQHHRVSSCSRNALDLYWKLLGSNLNCDTVACSPQANYYDQAAAACQRS
jgi:hypothetical protein